MGLLTLAINIALLTSIMFAQAEDTPPQIYYGGVEYDGAGSYTFTYTLKSGSPNITK